MVLPLEVAVNVTAPELCVKVPELVQLPPTVKLDEAGATRVAAALTVRFVVMAIVGFHALADSVSAFVPLPIVRLFVTVSVCEPAVPKVCVTVAAGDDSRL